MTITLLKEMAGSYYGYTNYTVVYYKQVLTINVLKQIVFEGRYRFGRRRFYRYGNYFVFFDI